VQAKPPLICLKIQFFSCAIFLGEIKTHRNNPFHEKSFGWQ
jgi:hypothetical protein